MEKKINKELTLEEWKEVAEKVRAVSDANRELFRILKEKFDKDVWEAMWFKADKSCGELRSHLDDILCSKFQDLPNEEVTRIFYKSQSER